MALKADQGDGDKRLGCLFRQIKRQKQRGKRLSHRALTRPADQKGHHAIAQYL